VTRRPVIRRSTHLLVREHGIPHLYAQNHIVDAVCRALDGQLRMTPKSGMDKLVTVLAPFIAVGLDRYCLEGYERG